MGSGKDPAVLFYTSDFLSGCALMDMRGAWAIYHASVPPTGTGAHDDAGDHARCQEAI